VIDDFQTTLHILHRQKIALYHFRLSLYQEWVPGIFWEQTAAGTLPYHHLRTECLDNVGSSTSHNLIGLHGLLRRELYFFICRWCSYLTGSTRASLHDLLRG
jgi:hypothetical protein